MRDDAAPLVAVMADDGEVMAFAPETPADLSAVLADP